MIGFAALMVATIVTIDAMRRLHLMAAFATMARDGRRAVRLLGHVGVSEWAKERGARLLAIRLFGDAVRGGALLGLVAAPLAIVLLLDAGRGFGVRACLLDWRYRIALLVVTSVYAFRGRSPERRERLLQRLTLGSVAVTDTSFAIERRLYLPHALRQGGGEAPVFVAGLARAGTSVLLRMLHETDAFASLAYRDLPFPLAPNAWARATRNSRLGLTAIERGHGDGLLHDLDTPEAIEELFWRVHEGDRYRRDGYLAPVPVGPVSIAAYREFVALVRLRYARPRYLAKTNNAVLRLPALVEVFPDACLVHPFRDPVQQAASLLEQHLNACALAHGDRFRRDFMSWLGHHEFGADHRPFALPGAPAADEDATRIAYWLKVWISVYTFLLDQPAGVRRRQSFVDFDALCRDPQAGTSALGEALGVGLDPAMLRAPAPRTGCVIPADLAAQAREVHRALIARSLAPDVTAGLRACG